jgi:hypothetical protein
MSDISEGAEATPAGAGAAATPDAATPDATPADTGWRDAITDEGARKLAERYSTPGDMAAAGVELNREMSQRIKIPGEDADEEAMGKYRKAIGVPETIEGYDLAKPEHVPQEVYDSEPTQDLLNAVLTAAHGAKDPKAAVQDMIAAYWQQDSAIQAEIARNDTAAAEAGEADLRKLWGADYEGNIAHGTRTVDRYSGIGNIEIKDGTLLASHPLFVRLAADLGRLTQEGAPQVGLQGTEAGADLRQEYDRLGSDIHKAYSSGDKITANRLDTQRQEISKKLHGDQSIVGGTRAV